MQEYMRQAKEEKVLEFIYCWELSGEGTYKEYLEVLDEEAKIAEERKIEIDQKEKEKKLIAQKKKNKNIKICIAAICMLVIVSVGISAYSNVAKEKQFEEEKLVISEHISNDEYDPAFIVMISSKNYDKLKKEYGEVLWEKQAELDKKFKDSSWAYAKYEEDMVYNEELARNGVCYYEFDEEADYGRYHYMYAVTENGEKHILYSQSCYGDDERAYVCGLGYNSWEEDFQSTMWSKDWLFITAIEKSYLSSSAYQYAVKYNKERNQVYEVKLSDDVGWKYGYAKMKDGNILISTETIDKIEEAKQVKLFDVVKGTVRELSYDELEKKYDGDVNGNILTVFE